MSLAATSFNGSYSDTIVLHGLMAPLATLVPPALMPTANHCRLCNWLYLGLFILVRRLLLFLQVGRNAVGHSHHICSRPATIGIRSDQRFL